MIRSVLIIHGYGTVHALLWQQEETSLDFLVPVPESYMRACRHDLSVHVGHPKQIREAQGGGPCKLRTRGIGCDGSTHHVSTAAWAHSAGHSCCVSTGCSVHCPLAELKEGQAKEKIRRLTDLMPEEQSCTYLGKGREGLHSCTHLGHLTTSSS
eukprot:1158297-Pelagomonas_calceolata.AAC.7